MERQDHPARLGFGVVARPEAHATQLTGLGPQLERLGYRELWANDGRGRSGLATLAMAGADCSLDLGLGVAPLSERSPADLAAEIDRLELPRRRLILGVGTGSGSSLAMVSGAVEELRRLLPDVRLAVAALGPRMCRLGGEIADVVLLNWAFPERIDWSRERIAEGARAARPAPRVAAYVRVALGADAEARLRAEADRYRGRPRRPYTRLFAEQAAEGDRVPGIATDEPGQVAPQLRAYLEALDTCVVRAVPAQDSPAELLEIARAAARMLRA